MTIALVKLYVYLENSVEVKPKAVNKNVNICDNTTVHQN
jgi:hypothetical protein